MSEALYLRDPDGNGVELYWDRPKEQWPRTPEGELAMVTEPLDIRDLLNVTPGHIASDNGSETNDNITEPPRRSESRDCICLER